MSDRARLILLQVLQEEVPHQVILAPDMLRHQMYLYKHGEISIVNFHYLLTRLNNLTYFKLIVDARAVAGPELMTLGAAIFDGSAQAYDHNALLFPNHLPEVVGRVH